MSQIFYATFKGGEVVLDEPIPQIPEGKRIKVLLIDNNTQEKDNNEEKDNESRQQK